MHNFVSIDNQPDLIRDISNHAIITNSSHKISEYNARKKAMSEKENEIQSLKNDMEEIKKMLQVLMQR